MRPPPIITTIDGEQDHMLCTTTTKNHLITYIHYKLVYRCIF